MTLTPRNLALVALAGSAALLVGALGFQYLGGMAPCKMCIWQRWPHGIAILIGLMAIWQPRPHWFALGALVLFIGGAIGVFHAGVEWGFWEGPSTCTSGSISGLSTDALFDQIMAAPVVRCDEIPWAFLGLSMAGWNAVFSFLLAGIWWRGYASSSASQ
ncbi:disulfide bond formation protein B [Oceanomicrobium pacificus]|uniref:Putative protein-disulfide oxidoreductase DsbI n=1 Tax=Oceanomicrobium pacificus TaxID=2692916 RepID=A0A6B0TWQ4_9RHOB|nr:disulfide bond formation protein B [Oceanomicrobium pacificus]MXU65928.1 disulfide bond formation protein B [Oceanomicrobium pacificus]